MSTAVATVVAPVATTRPDPPLAPALDEESRGWLRGLHASGALRDEAIARLHALLLRGARFEVDRRRATTRYLRGDDLDDLAQQAATTRSSASCAGSTAGTVEQRELLEALRLAIATSLTSHQRRVLLALALDDVPIDVLAERLETNRGALYETLRDAGASSAA